MDPSRKRKILDSLRRSVKSIIKARNESNDKCAKFAAYCIEDAFEGRLSNGLASNSKKSAVVFNAFRFQTHAKFTNLVIGLSFVHCLSIFVLECGEVNGFLHYLSVVLNITIYSVYILDVALKIAYEGFKEYMKHDWQRIYCFSILIMVMDFAINHGNYLAYSNFLRPVVGTLRSRSARRFFTCCKEMVPKLSQALIPLAFMISAIVMLNSIFLRHVPSEFTDISQLTYNWIWLTFTNDTFSDLMPEYLSKNVTYVACIFVGSYITQKFLLSLVLGATYDMFTELSKKQLTNENMKAMQGLVKAFSAMDVHNEGQLSRHMFGKCLHYYKPEFTNEDIALYYELISGGSQTISLLQFLQLKYVLSFHFIKRNDAKRLDEPILEIFDAGNDAGIASGSRKGGSVSISEAIERVHSGNISSPSQPGLGSKSDMNKFSPSCLGSKVCNSKSDSALNLKPCTSASMRGQKNKGLGLGYFLDFVLEKLFRVITGVTLMSLYAVNLIDIGLLLCNFYDTDLFSFRIHEALLPFDVVGFVPTNIKVTPCRLISVIYILQFCVLYMQGSVGRKSTTSGKANDNALFAADRKTYIGCTVLILFLDMGSNFLLHTSDLAPVATVLGPISHMFDSGGVGNVAGISASLLRAIFDHTMSFSQFVALLRFVRCWGHMIGANADCRSLVRAIPQIGPAFFQLMMLAFGFSFIFSMIGYNIFNYHISDAHIEKSVWQLGSDLKGEYVNHWTNPLHSLVTGLSLFLPVDFVKVMEETMAYNGPRTDIAYAMLQLQHSYGQCLGSLTSVSNVMNSCSVINNVVVCAPSSSTLNRHFSGVVSHTVSTLMQYLGLYFSTNIQSLNVKDYLCQLEYGYHYLVFVFPQLIYRPMAYAFFFSYFIFGLVICNLSLSIIIEWYSSHTVEEEEDENEVKFKNQQLFEVIVERARLRMVLCENNSFYDIGHSDGKGNLNEKLNFNSMSMGRSAVLDHRHKIFGDGYNQNVTIEQLKKCQKQAPKLNLIELYHAHVRGIHKNLDQDTDFLLEMKEYTVTGVQPMTPKMGFGYKPRLSTGTNLHKCHEMELKPGELLYGAGEEASFGYFVISGNVELTMTDSAGYQVTVVLQACNFVGIECLQPDAVYKSSCCAPTTSMTKMFADVPDDESSELANMDSQALPLNQKLNSDLKPLGIDTGNEADIPSNVKVLVIPQDMIVHELTERLSGIILRMAFKTKCIVDERIKQTVRNVNRRSSLIRFSSPVPMPVRTPTPQMDTDATEGTNGRTIVATPCDSLQQKAESRTAIMDPNLCMETNQIKCENMGTEPIPFSSSGGTTDFI